MPPPEKKRPHLLYGKINWGYNELKEVLGIELLQLYCCAPSYVYDSDQNGRGCQNFISIWNTLKVRSLLLNLSSTSSETREFDDLLLQLASTMCCKARHENWGSEIFKMWRCDLWNAGEKEGKYLQEQKKLQMALLERERPAPAIQNEVNEVKDEDKEEEAGQLPRSRSVMSAFLDPNLLRTGPKPIIHFIRHAEQEGDGKEIDFYTRDPGLTDEGKGQATALSQAFDRHAEVTHLIVSPLSRCVDTALLAFTPVIENRVKITLVPELQAAASCWSCIGLPLRQLKEKYSAEKHGDILVFDFVGHRWTDKLKGRFSSDQRSVYKRVKEIFMWCRDGQDIDDGEEGRREIVVVTHQSVLKHFDHTWNVPFAGWSTFTFDEDWKVYETPESKIRRYAPKPIMIEAQSPSISRTSTSSSKTVKQFHSKLPKKASSTVQYRPIFPPSPEKRIIKNIRDQSIFSPAGKKKYQYKS